MLGMSRGGYLNGRLLPLLHVQFRQTEDGWRLDRSYRGWHRRASPCLVDAEDVRSLNPCSPVIWLDAEP